MFTPFIELILTTDRLKRDQSASLIAEPLQPAGPGDGDDITADVSEYPSLVGCFC